jgi:hypothetical protein
MVRDEKAENNINNSSRRLRSCRSELLQEKLQWHSSADLLSLFNAVDSIVLTSPWGGGGVSTFL